MKKEILAICDGEIDYVYRLMDYLNKKNTIPFEVFAFSGYESLLTFLDDHQVDMLLTDAGKIKGKQLEERIPHIIYLSDGQSREDEGPAIYKYQSSEHIAGELLRHYAECAEGSRYYGDEKHSLQITAVFSPYGRCGKTSFSLVAGQIFAKEYPVLYINLEAYSGLECWLHEKSSTSLADIISAMRQKVHNFSLRFRASVRSAGQLDYIAAADYPVDLKHVEAEEWKAFFEFLSNESIYERLILDIGDQIPLDVLNLCHNIYMPIPADSTEHKKNHFYHILTILDLEHLKERIRPVTIPYYPEERELEQMRWGETGIFISDLLRKEEK